MKRQDLHEYQTYCVRFLMEHPEAMLILEMGLGKSAVSLTAILDLMFDSFEVSKTLVIAPLRVAKTVWPQEREAWEHANFLRMSVMTGSAKQRETALKALADVYVINRENIKWLVDYLEKRRIPWPFDMVVIDELSSFKNHSSQRWKALRKVRPKIRRMVGLTGTPAGGGLMDLWAEFRLLDMGRRLGKFITHYREAFFLPDRRSAQQVFTWKPKPGAEDEIYRRMEPQERKLYEELKKELLVEVDGENIDAANAAVLSGKLLQMANGAIYNDSREVIPVHRQKLLMLEDLIEQANGQNVLVAYWYQHDRSRILEFLTEKGYQPRDIKTEADISEWNAGHIQVGLISPAGAGHGLNIQRGGHILIWFSMIWSLEMYQQTNARLWRQGQKEVVTAHHIVCRDTVDEDVLKALEHKDTTQQNLIAAVKAHLTI